MNRLFLLPGLAGLLAAAGGRKDDVTSNGQFYFGSQPFTTQTSSVLTPALTAVSETDAVRLTKQL